MSAMAPFADFTTLCARLVSTASRLGKRRLVAEYLRALPPDDVPNAVAFLTGRPFPVSDPRVLNVRGLPAPGGAASGPPLTLADVVAAFAQVAEAAGAGARRLKEQCLSALAVRASDAEREVIGRIIGGEMRTGVSDGLVLEAIAEAAGADLARTRRAALFLGDLASVAALALTGGPDALAAVTPRLFVPMLPMLAEITSDFGEVFAAQGGVTALEFKYDGARIQVHSDGQRVGIWSRRLSGVMAKDLRAAYEPGGRGKRWFKLKAAETVDCVIIAADRGSGRRMGWLSNYHLAVRDGDGWADVGKTFKGLTDQEFTAMTERLKSLAVGDDGYTVRVTPEIVVEVEYNEIQKSPTYPSGLALRFARIARIRDDKAPGQTTTLAQLRDLYEAQFRTKGRAG